MQNPASFENQKKSSYQAHRHNGLLLQGYEPQVVQYISVLYGYHLENGSDYLRRTNQSIIWVDQDGKSHHTFPDFYVDEINCFIEVKSAYTREKNDYKIQRTAEVCRQKGWGYCVITHYPHREYFRFVTETLGI